MRFSFLSILRQPAIYQIIDAFRRIQDVSRMNYVFIAMQTCPKSLPNLVERIRRFHDHSTRPGSPRNATLLFSVDHRLGKFFQLDAEHQKILFG